MLNTIFENTKQEIIELLALYPATH